jgi:hypothetical protein
LTFAYTLNVAATVTFNLKRKASGRLVNGKCVKQTSKNVTNKRCTRLVSVPGKITHVSSTGANSFTFNGKIGGHKLQAGTYQLTVTPTGGAAKTVTFRILP